MVTPWRIQLQNIDRSQTTTTPMGTVGAIVIRAPRGPSIPMYFSPGDEARILRIYGKPSAYYPDIWEAIQFNRGFGIWISAPFTDVDTYGASILKSSGSEAIVSGLTQDALDGYIFTATTDYALFITKSPATEDYVLGTKTTYDDVNEVYITTIGQKKGTTWVPLETLTYSFTPGAKDGYGRLVYYENVFSRSDYVMCVLNPNFEEATPVFEDDAEYVELSGATRAGTLTSVEVSSAWDQFKDVNKYAFDIAMDNTCFDGIDTVFDTLRREYQTFSDYLYPVAQGVSGSEAITNRGTSGTDNDGLVMFINHLATVDTYNGGYFWTSWIGRIGYQYALMDDIYNGLAPSWINDAQGHGGQLGPGLASPGADQSFSENQLRLLDNAGINPVDADPNFGVMVKSQRTMKSNASISDYNYVDRRRLFDYIKKNIIRQVLIYYINKKNNSTNRNELRARCEQIIAPIVGRGLLSEAVVICDEHNNNDIVRAESKLVVDVGVKVIPSAEMIMFNFVNAGQTITVTDAIAGRG